MRLGSTITTIALATSFLSMQAHAADIYRGDTGGSLKDAPYAASPSLYYFALRGGATFPADTDFDVDALEVSIDNEYDDAGFIVSGALGMSMAGLTGVDGLRGELEIGYFSNDIDAHVLDDGLARTRIGGGDAFGETSAVFGLVNLFYDFNQFGRIKPFIGGGVGIAQVSFEDHAVNLDGERVDALDDDDTGFAYQLSAGANFTISESVDFELGYRYLGIAGVELEAVDGTQSDVDIDNHVVYGGLRFKM